MMSLFLGVVCWAIPADRTPMPVTQSDGSKLTLRLVGDEFFHYNTTDDGYTVLRNASGSYEYAVKRGDVLVSSGVLAHDASIRTPAERQLLSQVGKHLRGTSDVQQARLSRAKAQQPLKREPVVDYSNFRGLIILINYTDRQFSMDDPHEFYDKMVNQENYTGFDFNGRFQRCTGSMYDYFNDQSGGIFKPQFDIIGPIDLDFACTDHNGTNNSWQIFSTAFNIASSMVNMSDYDNNGDGAVDMVYFLVAGYSANYSGNNSGYLWPHKSYLFNPENHTWIPYASSTEIYGWESQGYPIPLGIGTMTHEFSHVLGLPDLYDTDYEEHGQSHDPGGWDVMAGGDYNMGRTPCAYSAWERYALGWSQPREIKAAGSYSLQNVGTTGDGIILRTPVEGEFFMLDNRQNVKWDAALPGHGMLIARVDSTNEQVWWNNEVNCDPNHNYYELLRAGNSSSGAKSNDPFPGTSSVTTIDNFTTPSLKTWAGIENLFMLTQITEDEGVITFQVQDVEPPLLMVEDFETMAVSDEKWVDDVPGNFAKWTFKNAHVQNIEEDGQSNHVAAMYKGSLIVMTTPLRYDAYHMRFRVINPNTATAKYTIYRSEDQTNWVKMNNVAFEVHGGDSKLFSANLSLTVPTYFRINMTAGAVNSPTYVDDVTFVYSNQFDTITGDVTGDGMVDISDVNALINMMLGKAAPTPEADINSDGNVDISDVNAVINLMLGKV